MIPKYSANGKKPTWYGVAIDNGYETKTIFNSYSLVACQKFIRRAQQLFNETLFISSWVRDDRGLVWAIKDLEHRAEV